MLAKNEKETNDILFYIFLFTLFLTGSLMVAGSLHVKNKLILECVQTGNTPEDCAKAIQ